jgi:hypothetical protein
VSGDGIQNSEQKNGWMLLIPGLVIMKNRIQSSDFHITGTTANNLLNGSCNF